MVGQLWNRIDRWHPLVYALLSFIIIGTYLSGYFINVDTYSTPKMKLSFDFPWALNPLYLLMFLMSMLVPTHIVSWLLLFAIVFLSGTSMHRFLERKAKIESPVAKYFAGFFYAINPFIYARFLVGHTPLLLGYALFPFFLSAVINFLEETIDDKERRKRFVILCVWFFVMGAMAIHNLLMAILAFIFLFVWNIIGARDNSKIKMIKEAIIIGVAIVLLNSYWILPALANPYAGIGIVSERDIDVFRTTQEHGMNILVTVASLYGFWRNVAFIEPNNILPAWLVYGLFFAILYLAVYGFIRSDKKWKVPVAALAVIAFLLAVGSSWTVTSGLFNFLFNSFDPIKVFREPQKLVALVAFAYACFGAVGVNGLIQQLKDKEKNNKRWKFAVIIVFLLILAIPFIYTPTMFNNFWGQINPTQYPMDWFEVNSFLNSDTGNGDFNVLFLPWHMYMDFRWINNTDKRASNMAGTFFDKNTIAGDNMEVGSIYSSSTNPRSKQLELIFAQGREGNLTDIGNKLSTYGIRYVLLTKEVDYQTYNFLFNQTDIEMKKETENFYVFKNNVPAFKSPSDDLLNDPVKFYAFASGGTITLLSLAGLVWFWRKEVKTGTQ